MFFINYFIMADWHKTQTKYRSKSQPILTLLGTGGVFNTPPTENQL